ncbi:MAG: hypothetical protein CMJ83_21440 [Planctomycetes bacterium]|nr:hypothetical protein [Planctomycetota bacterium]
MATNYRRSEIVSGGFILLAVFVFCLFAFKVGGLNLLGFLDGSTKTFQTMFPQVDTLEVGAKVAIGGRRVGRVTRIEYAPAVDVDSFHTNWSNLWGAGQSWDEYAAAVKAVDGRVLEDPKDPPRILVWFEIDEDEVETEGGDTRRLKLAGKSARALLVQDGFLGQHFIQIHPGPIDQQQGALEIFGDDKPDWGSSDNPIPVVGKVAGLLQLFEEVAGPTLDQLEQVLRKANERILSDDNLAHLDNMFANVDDLVKNGSLLIQDIRPLFQQGNPRSLEETVLKDLRGLLQNADTTLDTLRTDLQQKIISKVSSLVDNGNATVTAAREALKKVDGLLDESRPRVKQILVNLEDGTKDLDKRLDALQTKVDEVVAAVMKPLDNIDGAITDNRPNLAETMSSLRRTMWELEIAMRKVRANPAVVLFGDDEKILGLHPMDESNRRRSGRARPYEQRDENEGK